MTGRVRTKGRRDPKRSGRRQTMSGSVSYNEQSSMVRKQRDFDSLKPNASP